MNNCLNCREEAVFDSRGLEFKGMRSRKMREKLPVSCNGRMNHSYERSNNKLPLFSGTSSC